MLYNIPGGASGLAEGTDEHTQGVSDFGSPGYGGPMPPPGHGVHHYFFWLLALDANVDLEPGLGMWDLLDRHRATRDRDEPTGRHLYPGLSTRG